VLYYDLLKSGTSRATAGLKENILAVVVGLVWEKNFRLLFFKIAHSGVLYICETAGPPNVAGPEENFLVKVVVQHLCNKSNDGACALAVTF